VSDAEWKRRLSKQSYRTLRREDTEPPNSSRFTDDPRRGTYACAGCSLPLFKSEWKFHSGTGWPSFWTATKTNIGTKRDLVLLIPRTEYHCARCLGHQGHIFNDGPPQHGGIRYCNNGAALRFVPS
jgi:peptide-methionine (R)-S-oxide reductase